MKTAYILLLTILIGFTDTIKEDIDHESLVDYGEFLMDKNKVYRRYNTSDETLILELENVDRNSFMPLGNSIYGKDKQHVFSSRNGIIEGADVGTFEAIHVETNDGVAYGKDKNNYYFWNQVVSDTVGFAEILRQK